jgi:hypothetical protein
MATMPDIDRTADIKVIAAQGMVTAEIPLAGHASEHWLALFRKLTTRGGASPAAKAEDQEDRTWVIVILPAASTDLHPRVDAGCRKCSDQPGQRHGAAGSVRHRSNRGRYPRLVGAAAAVAASPPLVLAKA